MTLGHSAQDEEKKAGEPSKTSVFEPDTQT